MIQITLPNVITIALAGALGYALLAGLALMFQRGGFGGAGA